MLQPIWIGTAAVAAAGLLSAGVWRLGAKSQRPRVAPNTELPEGPYMPIGFRSGNSRVKGWMLWPKEGGAPPLPAVIVAHGWGSNRSRVLRYAGPLLEEGYAVFLYDARSHGESDPIAAPSGLMFREDVKAAVKLVRSMPQIDPERVAVLGHSLGGYGALAAYAQGLPVRAVVTDSAPLSMEAMLRAELTRRRLPHFPLGLLIPRIWLRRAGIAMREARAADMRAWLLAQRDAARLPILLVHSRRDGYVQPDELLRVAERVPIRHRLVDVEGHSRSQEDPAFWEAVLPFLREAMHPSDDRTSPAKASE